MSTPAVPPASPPSTGGYPPEGSQPTGAPPASGGSNGLAIAGLVLAFVAFPVGFVISLVALIQARRRHQKGSLLAVLGLIVATVELVALVVVLVIVGKGVATLTDPGCTKGKAALFANGDLGGGTDPTVMKTKARTLISELDAAAAQAQHDNVRAAMKALSSDYDTLLKAVDSGKMPPADFQAKLTKDATAIDSLCTLGGAEK